MRVLFRPLLQDVALQIRHGSCPPSGSGQSVFRRGGRRIPLGGRGFPHRGALLLDKQQDRRGSPGGGCVQGRQVTWRDFRLTLADALTGARLVMLPYLIYALARPLPDLAVGTLAVMIGTDLVDGRIARALGQSREFGGAFDSTVDFVVIYGIFTAFLAVGVLPWWKWAVIVPRRRQDRRPNPVRLPAVSPVAPFLAGSRVGPDGGPCTLRPACPCDHLQHDRLRPDPAAATRPPRYAGGDPVSARRLSLVDQLFLSLHWFSLNYHWGALLTIVVPAAVARQVLPAQREQCWGSSPPWAPSWRWSCSRWPEPSAI